MVAGVVAAVAPFVQPGRGAITAQQYLRAQVVASTAVTVALGLAPINAHAWYTIWALAPIALIWTISAQSSRARWLAPCLTWLLLSFLVYHTWPAIGVKVS